MSAYYRVGTIANATRARKILGTHGVHAYIKRRTDHEGCGYAVMVTNDSPLVITWLKNGGVTIYGTEGDD